jgi:tripartite-type tricarboxylate transporter receptor subunit TctC
MKFSRRQILHLAGGAALLPAVSPVARAQAYPTRPVRIIVGFPAGGSTDIYARLIGRWLSERFGAPFVVENRPGAGSNLGAEAVVKAPPDGYTLLLVTGNNAVSATLFDKLNFDFVRDIAPVASIARSPAVLVVNPAVPATTVPELIAYAKSDPGKLNMGSGGNGSVQHVYGELFKMMTGVSMLHVPYRGTAPALADLVGGQVQVMFDTLSTSLEFIKAGKLRALAVTTAARLEVLPDVPTVGDFVPGYEASGWLGLGAPKGTSIEIVDKLSKEVSAGLADPKLRARVADLGGTVFTLSPTEFRKFIAEEIEKWGKVVKFAGIKAE